MKLGEYKETLNYYSSEASKLNRQFAFAGIAIIWIISSAEIDITNINSFLFALIPFVLTLLIDLLQYAVAYILWHRFYRQHEKKEFSDMDEVEGSSSNDSIINALWYAKIIFNIFGYLLLTCYIISILF